MEKLNARLEQLLPAGVLLAYSGGADSSLLLGAAVRLPGRLLAVTFSTPLQARNELREAAAFAAACGAAFRSETVDVLRLRPELRNNPRERCYLCKHALFSALRRLADARSLRYIVDGTNADDLGVFRPGRAALAELGVKSPLAELGISKARVRELAAALGIPAAGRPASPCLATRLPYGAKVTPELLERIEKGEALLRGSGFPVVRLRIHGAVARIEIPPADFSRFLDRKEEFLPRLEKLGFHYCTLDLKGFRSGSMDE